jgi:hypothetical protein
MTIFIQKDKYSNVDTIKKYNFLGVHKIIGAIWTILRSLMKS